MSQDRFDEMLSRYSTNGTDAESSTPQPSADHDQGQDQPSDDRPNFIERIKPMILPVLLGVGALWGLITYLF